MLPAPGGTRLIIWNEQPLDPRERQTALAALHEVYRENYRDLLSGILYWKLSTSETHASLEPYVLHVGTASKDRLQEILLRFAR